MADLGFGGVLNDYFATGGEGFAGTVITTFSYTFLVLFILGIIGLYLFVMVRYPRKKIIIDCYNNKIRKDRVGIIKHNDGTEFLKFFWTKYLSFPPIRPTNVFIKFGASKFDIAPAYGNPTNVYDEVSKLMNLNPFKKTSVPSWVQRDVNKMIDDKRLQPVDYDAMNVFASSLPLQTKKYQTPGVWEKYGTTISMLMVLVTMFIFFFFLADQFGGVAEVLKQSIDSAKDYVPPRP